MMTTRRTNTTTALVGGLASAALLWGVQAGTGEGPRLSATGASVAVPAADPASRKADSRRKLGEPWKYDGRTALYQTHEVKDPRGILFVAGQTAKDKSNTYLHLWDMQKQIDRVFDQVEKYVEDAGYKPSEITNLRYSVTDEDLFFRHFDRVIDRLDRAGIKPTSAAIGVERLARPGVLIEIEATAVR
ncbi:RidA family protein [Streptomyces qinzhouensis]|uniref:RidA family protein n=1 Tax=Streptomyces qinzhouensis TaxID=2599401 RepID=A0A5B8JKJ3_9ACTN|nr:RidA family protein [Streptomyces qinzhouensis]QDY80421.1 RidA family protein [Streptomyces qinzhouensis]